VIGVECERPATRSTPPAIVVRSLTEHGLSLQLDELGLTDCLTPTDREMPATLSIVAPDELACSRAVESFSGPSSLLRHQVGHRLWERLVGQSDHVAAFWLVFGHPPTADARTHPTPGAIEQWAETFDTYLLILDIAGTAAERGLLVLRAPYDPIALPFAVIFNHALPYLGSIPASACDGSTRKGGVRVMSNKLTYVHSRVSAHSKRARFYSLD